MTGPARDMVGHARPSRDWHLEDFDRAVGLEGVQKARQILDAAPHYESAKFGSNSTPIQCECRIVRDGECVLCHTARKD